MPKSDEYREMQISSGQLAAVILTLLALCVLIFYLGIRVGAKRASGEAAEAALRAETRTSAPVKTIPAAPKTAAPSVSAADIAAAITETKAEAKAKPADVAPAETQPAAKTGSIPASADAKTAPAEAKAKTAAAKTAAAVSPSGSFYVQAGAVDGRSGAEAYALKIEGLGFRAIVLNPFPTDKKTLYRVRVGPYETKESAERGRAKLAAALKKKPGDFFIVKG